MLMKSRMRRFFSIKSNWVNVIIFAIAVIALAISFFFEGYSHQIIGIMFTLIVVENFITKITYMDDIIQKLGNSKGMVMMREEDDCTPVPEVIKRAEKEMFISAATLISYHKYLPEIARRTNLERIRLLVYTDEMGEIYDKLKRTGARGISTSFLTPYSDGSIGNVEIRKIDSFMPTTFFAIDMSTHGGYIRATYLFNDHQESPYMPSVEFTPNDGEWYSIHKNQMEALWKRAEPWNESREAGES